MKKSTIVLLVIGIIAVLALGYVYLIRPKVGADVAGAVPVKILSDKTLTLKQISTDKYQIREAVGIGGGFGIQVLYPSRTTTRWDRSSDVGLIVLDTTYNNAAVYPITNGPHQINCVIGARTVTVEFSTAGYTATQTPIPPPTPTPKPGTPTPRPGTPIPAAYTYQMTLHPENPNWTDTISVVSPQNITVGQSIGLVAHWPASRSAKAPVVSDTSVIKFTETGSGTDGCAAKITGLKKGSATITYSNGLTSNSFVINVN